MNNRGFTFVELIIVLAVLLVLCLAILSPFVKFSTTGAGEHTGFITAVEQEGIFFPNYRVYVKTDNSSSQEDIYCMHRDKTTLANALKEYSKKRELVEVSFKGVRGVGVGLCSDVEITNVKPLNR